MEAGSGVNAHSLYLYGKVMGLLLFSSIGFLRPSVENGAGSIAFSIWYLLIVCSLFNAAKLEEDECTKPQAF
jgi:hypothetical protein